VAIREAGTLQRLPATQTMVTTESPASRDSPITLRWKQTGKPIAGNRHDGFEVAGAGTQLTVRLMRHSQRKQGAPARRNLRSMALALDPTGSTTWGLRWPQLPRARFYGIGFELVRSHNWLA
jgi:hypothetical protein